MKKTAIIYASTHHENTRKLVETISAKYEITIINANKVQIADFLNTS